jgi:hypothetical protein
MVEDEDGEVMRNMVWRGWKAKVRFKISSQFLFMGSGFEIIF